jgi:DNA modification methylase
VAEQKTGQLPLPTGENREEVASRINKKTRPQPSKRANELDGKTWERYSISIWSDIRKTAEETKLGHPAMFPIALIIRLIQCFMAREDRTVLDPFAGVGSTAIAAELMGKVGVGIEISSEFCEKARKREAVVSYEFDADASTKGKSFNGVSLPAELGERRIFTDDATNLLKYVDPNTIDFVVTSPPYWDILLQERSADQKEIRHYGESTADLGKIRHYDAFLHALEGIFRLVYEALRPGKYCCVIVMDLRKKDRFYPYHADVATFMQAIGFIFDDIIIWDRRHEYNLMRPLGYPYKFRINKAHEYILIFQKPNSEKTSTSSR